jgi:hypothetical protein
LSAELNPPSLAEAVAAKGFTGAVGIVEAKTGYAELALARRDDLVQFFRHCAFGTAMMRALDLPAEFR